MRDAKIFLSTMIAVCVIPVFSVRAAGETSIQHGNNRRAGYTDAVAPATPVLQWTYTEKHPPRHAWKEPNRELQYIDFDYATQVSISEGLLVFGSSADHTVRALDLDSGDQRWWFCTEGPVRFAPAINAGRVYVASDDGYVYALSLADGELIWKFRGGPSNGKLIGNEQMISHWPARSGVLVDQGRLYFTAGMWSRDGVFIYCLDAGDGSVLWKNDTSGFHFTSLPHSSGLAGVAPQGYLALHQGRLYVPTGRGAPAYFDAETGEFLFYENGQGYKPHQEGGSRVMAWKKWVIFKRRVQHVEESVRYEERLAGPGAVSGLYALDARTGTPQWALTGKHVASAHGNTMILAGQGPVIKVNIDELMEGYAQYWSDGKRVKDDPNVPRNELPYAWSTVKDTAFPALMSPMPYKKWATDVGYVFTLLRAGETVLAGGRGQISAIDFNTGRALWRHEIEGDARGICVADGRIVVSSTVGKLYVFGEASPSGPREVVPPIEMPLTSEESGRLAASVLDASGVRDGYALLLGVRDGELLCELARQSRLTVYCLEPDPAKADQARRMLDRAGLLGVRAAVHVGGFEQLPYSPYCANLVVWGETQGSSIRELRASELHRVLRPYGGVAVQLRGKDTIDATRMWLAEGQVPPAEIEDSDGGLIVTRGELAGAGEWTHAYANIGRTGCSEDAIARLPLGMLWWGGPGPARTVSRHWRAPIPLFSKGRLFIQGQHDVMAVDAYNGREMWNRHIEGVGRFPPANRGGNIVADEDSVYCIQETKCLRLDAQSGETRFQYEFPLDEEHREAIEALAKNYRSPRETRIVWEYLGVCGDYLLGSLGNEELITGNSSQPYFDAAGQARYLFAFNKTSGELVWERKMDRAVSPMAIVADSQCVYFLDRTDERLYQQGARRGDSDFASSLNALDLATGKLLWTQSGILMQRKSLLLKDDCVVSYPNPIEHETIQGDSGVAVYSAVDGRVLWEKETLAGVSGGGRGAVIRHTFVVDDTLFLPWAYDLHTGEEKLLHRNPLTGECERFGVDGQNFCGTIAAGRNLLAYRSASVGFQEIGRDSGSFWLPEVRPSCWISVVPAGGLVLAPEGYGTCICPYNYKTSVALMPVERYEDWAVYLAGNKYALQQRKTRSKQVVAVDFERLHINLGAPGDRIDSHDQVWMAIPRPTSREKRERYLDTQLPVTVAGVVTAARVNADFHTIHGTETPWLFTSALEGPLEIRIALPSAPACRYRVELMFAETDTLEAGDRVFDIVIDGKTVESKYDIAAKAKSANQAYVAVFEGIEASEELSIRLSPVAGRPPRLCSFVLSKEQ